MKCCLVSVHRVLIDWCCVCTILREMVRVNELIINKVLYFHKKEKALLMKVEKGRINTDWSWSFNIFAFSFVSLWRQSFLDNGGIPCWSVLEFFRNWNSFLPVSLITPGHPRIPQGTPGQHYLYVQYII